MIVAAIVLLLSGLWIFTIGLAATINNDAPKPANKELNNYIRKVG